MKLADSTLKLLVAASICSLMLSNDCFAANERPLIRLAEGGFGSAGDWELRLESNGRVVEEHSDLYAKTEEGLHTETIVRTLSAPEIKALVTKAAMLVGELPTYIDDDGQIFVDTETRSIRVIDAGIEQFSGWDRYAHKPSTPRSRKFMAAWRRLTDMLRGAHASAHRTDKRRRQNP